ncbi:MAG: hypothetical protein PHI31_09820 [Desulfuromonadaceae bacterium]|nr:hypothetical protein [Desulfuromonadaceae bacterium]
MGGSAAGGTEGGVGSAGSGAELYSTFMKNYKSPAADEMLAKEAASRAGQGMSAMQPLQQFQVPRSPSQTMQPMNPMANYMRRYYGR